MGPVDNRSAEPEAGLVVARFAGQGLAARELLGRAPAALELRVRIDHLDADPVASTGARSSTGVPKRIALWRARGRLTLELVDTTSGEDKVVAAGAVSGTEDYQGGDDIEATEVSRDLALERLLERLVRDGLDRITAK